MTMPAAVMSSVTTIVATMAAAVPSVVAALLTARRLRRLDEALDFVAIERRSGDRNRLRQVHRTARGGTSDLGGLSASETFNVAVTTTPTQTSSLFAATATPALTSLNDCQQLEVGVKFTSSATGQITALKFYRSASDTGQDVLDLWSATGTKLASATFTNTTASGWQTVALAAPVSIAANTTYVASYHTTSACVATSNGLASAIVSGPLTALASGAAGGNGVYDYGGSSTTGLFPTDSYNAANYFADVVFQPQLTS
jgi:hypothetical protein